MSKLDYYSANVFAGEDIPNHVSSPAEQGKPQKTSNQRTKRDTDSQQKREERLTRLHSSLTQKKRELEAKNLSTYRKLGQIYLIMKSRNPGRYIKWLQEQGIERRTASNHIKVATNWKDIERLLSQNNGTVSLTQALSSLKTNESATICESDCEVHHRVEAKVEAGVQARQQCAKLIQRVIDFIATLEEPMKQEAIQQFKTRAASLGLGNLQTERASAQVEER